MNRPTDTTQVLVTNSDGTTYDQSLLILFSPSSECGDVIEWGFNSPTAYMANKPSKQTQNIIAYVGENRGKFSVREVADHFNITPASVYTIKNNNSISDDFRQEKCGTKGNGIIKLDSSLKGGPVMQKATKADLGALQEHCEKHGLPFGSQRLWWHKTQEFSVSFYDAEKLEEDQNRFDDFLKDIKKASKRVKVKPLPSKTLAIPANMDVHIGKRCEMIISGCEYTPEQAVTQVREGVASLTAMTKPFGVTDILLPLGNDIVHVDSNANRTTNGTPQDTYGSLESQMLLAAQMYIGMIEQMAKTQNVWLCHVHSNHDRVSGWAVSRIVAAHFHNNPRVRWTEDGMSQQHRKYFVFGDNLIMLHHGEAKEEKLMGLIEAEARLAVSQTKRTYVYQGHTHHKSTSRRGVNTDNLVEKDHSALSVIRAGNGAQNRTFVETVRSPSPADQWHSQSGYMNMPAVEMYLHDEHSQFARFTHWFE